MKTILVMSLKSGVQFDYCSLPCFLSSPRSLCGVEVAVNYLIGKHTLTEMSRKHDFSLPFLFGGIISDRMAVFVRGWSSKDRVWAACRSGLPAHKPTPSFRSWDSLLLSWCCLWFSSPIKPSAHGLSGAPFFQAALGWRVSMPHHLPTAGSP